MATKTKPAAKKAPSKTAPKSTGKPVSKAALAARAALNYDEPISISQEDLQAVENVSLDAPWSEPVCTVTDLPVPEPLNQEPKTDIGTGKVVWATLDNQPRCRPAAKPGDVVTFAELVGK